MPHEKQIQWWKKKNDQDVFDAMFDLCIRVRDGKADKEQKSQCCGVIGCGGNHGRGEPCVRQTGWTTGRLNIFYILHNTIVFHNTL